MRQFLFLAERFQPIARIRVIACRAQADIYRKLLAGAPLVNAADGATSP